MEHATIRSTPERTNADLIIDFLILTSFWCGTAPSPLKGSAAPPSQPSYYVLLWHEIPGCFLRLSPRGPGVVEMEHPARANGEFVLREKFTLH